MMDVFEAPKQIWFFSDPHFGHASLVHGSMNQPKPSRPGFASVEAMCERIVENHNAVVRARDHWYCLGDVALHEAFIPWLEKLNGHGRLILGNHDGAPVRDYLKFVGKVMAYREFDGIMFSHIPIAPWSMRWRANVHGHCHLAKPLFYECADPDLLGHSCKVQYINISAEHTNYRPIALEVIQKWVSKCTS